MSVVVTTLNEQNSILVLLRSLLNQTLHPSEIIIVDGGSTDKTVKLINQFKMKHTELNIRLINEKGNIAHGRNIGIRNAKSNIIAMIDAGCIADKNWLKFLSKPFLTEKHIVAAGFYIMDADNYFEKSVSLYLGVTPNKFKRTNYLPSARSIAFSKSVWKKLGTFEEKLYLAGEDTLFIFNAVKHKIPIIRCPDALVTWQVPQSLIQICKKFYFYAKGDAETAIWWHPVKKFQTHNIKIVTIYIRYLFFISLLILSLLGFINLMLFVFVIFIYLMWAVLKHRSEISHVLMIIYIPLIQVLSDICVMLGFTSGIFHSST